MIAQGADGIRHGGGYLRDHLIPGIADPFVADDLRTVAQQFDVMAEEFDRAVDNQVRDRVALETFFGAVLPHLDGDAAAAVRAALADRVEGLRVADLVARGDRDMAAFIAAHSRIDRGVVAGEVWATPLRDRAWTFLDAWLERRRYRTVG